MFTIYWVSDIKHYRDQTLNRLHITDYRLKITDYILQRLHITEIPDYTL